MSNSCWPLERHFPEVLYADTDLRFPVSPTHLDLVMRFFLDRPFSDPSGLSHGYFRMPPPLYFLPFLLFEL